MPLLELSCTSASVCERNAQESGIDKGDHCYLDRSYCMSESKTRT